MMMMTSMLAVWTAYYIRDVSTDNRFQMSARLSIVPTNPNQHLNKERDAFFGWCLCPLRRCLAFERCRGAQRIRTLCAAVALRGGATVATVRPTWRLQCKISDVTASFLYFNATSLYVAYGADCVPDYIQMCDAMMLCKNQR